MKKLYVLDVLSDFFSQGTGAPSADMRDDTFQADSIIYPWIEMRKNKR